MAKHKKPKDPRSNKELRQAALLAEAWLLVASARAYGLIEGGPTINNLRCYQLIEMAESKGIRYTKDDVLGICRKISLRGGS